MKFHALNYVNHYDPDIGRIRSDGKRIEIYITNVDFKTYGFVNKIDPIGTTSSDIIPVFLCRKNIVEDGVEYYIKASKDLGFMKLDPYPKFISDLNTIIELYHPELSEERSLEKFGTKSILKDLGRMELHRPEDMIPIRLSDVVKCVDKINTKLGEKWSGTSSFRIWLGDLFPKRIIEAASKYFLAAGWSECIIKESHKDNFVIIIKQTEQSVNEILNRHQQ